MSFSQNLYNIRKKRQLSQKKLSELANVSQASINYWEKGQRTPSIGAIEKLANALDVSIMTLYGLDLKEEMGTSVTGVASLLGKSLVEKQIDKEKKEKLLTCFNDLNDSGKEKAIEQVELLAKIPEYKKDPGNDNQDQE